MYSDKLTLVAHIILSSHELLSHLHVYAIHIQKLMLTAAQY